MRTNIKNGKPVLFARVFLFLTSQISDDATVFAPNRKITVRISGDGVIVANDSPKF